MNTTPPSPVPKLVAASERARDTNRGGRSGFTPMSKGVTAGPSPCTMGAHQRAHAATTLVTVRMWCVSTHSPRPPWGRYTKCQIGAVYVRPQGPKSPKNTQSPAHSKRKPTCSGVRAAWLLRTVSHMRTM